MKKLSLLLISLSPAFVFAGSVNNGGWYVGLNAGGANQIVSYNPSAFNLNTNGSELYNPSWGFVGRVDGGYNFNKWSGLELGAAYYSGSGSSYPTGSGTFNPSTSSLDFSYIAYLPISQTDFSVFGRIGIAYDWINNDGTSSGCNCSGVAALDPSGSNFADVLGAGIRYKMSMHSSLKLEWLANGLIFPVGINSGSTSVANWSAQTFQIGAAYHF